MSSHAPGTPARTYPPRPEAVYFYATCLVDMFVPEAGMDAITLLEREGIRVIFPDNQTCCGQPAFTSGFPDEARQVVESQLGLFPGDYPIVVPSGSCAGMIRWHWEKVVGNDPALKARAAAIAARTFEFAEFLLHVVGFSRKDEGPATTVTLHTSCSARREMGTHLVGRELLARLGNVTLAHHDHESECCGFGGTFAVKNSEVSVAMGSDKVNHAVETGAEYLVAGDNSCLMHIGGLLSRMRAGVTPIHLAEILASTEDALVAAGATAPQQGGSR